MSSIAKNSHVTKQGVRDTRSLAPTILLILMGGTALFIVLLVGLGLVYSMAYAGRIFPGVRVAGVDLSGLSAAQAQALLVQQIQYPESGKIVFQDDQRVWVARPVDLGLQFDAAQSAQAAYALGRQGDPLTRPIQQIIAWYRGRDLPPVMIYDERQARAYLSALSGLIDQPTLEASLRFSGVEVIETPSQVGRRLDIPTTLVNLQGQMQGLTDSMLPLTILESPPEIVSASQAADAARKILSAPLVLSIPDAQDGDPGPWAFEPKQVAEWLALERVETPQGAQVALAVKTDYLRQILSELAPKLARFPGNARFVFNDETHQLELIQPAVIGRALEVEPSLQAIAEKMLQNEHNIPLAFNYSQPQVGSDATAASLGITELVSSYTSYFRGSSAARIQNIETAASRFHGLLVPPGATFSMAEAMGDVSLDSGYTEALIIYGGQTIKGVGGGVCQVSTTLFRTAFFAGFPILERTPHAYRVGYYEQDANGFDSDLAGLDATVFVPVVDFKFVNDSSSWLLMETYVNRKAGRITWKFYSTGDGRSVDWNTSGPQNIVPPPEPRYEENPDLAPGETKQVDWAAEGADVTVNRVVRRGDQVLFTDQFHTHYEPWQDVYQYGPGTQIP